MKQVIYTCNICKKVIEAKSHIFDMRITLAPLINNFPPRAVVSKEVNHICLKCLGQRCPDIVEAAVASHKPQKDLDTELMDIFVALVKDAVFNKEIN